MKSACSVSLAALALLAGLLNGPRGPEQTPTGPAAAAGPELWRKAVEIYRANHDWYPEKAAIASEVRDGRKRFRSLTEMFFTLSPDGRGRLRIHLDRSLRNGVDTTEKMRAKVRIRDPLERLAPSGGNAYSVSISDSPFDPGEQAAVSFASTKETRMLSGRSCRRFDFTFRAKIADEDGSKRLTWTGRAWIEEGSGVPARLEFSIAPLPGKFRSIWIVYEYETERPDHWVVKSVVISGHGGVLFIKRYFHVTTTFSEYRRMPAAGPEIP